MAKYPAIAALVYRKEACGRLTRLAVAVGTAHSVTSLQGAADGMIRMGCWG